jgi:hypothetical protein
MIYQEIKSEGNKEDYDEKIKIVFYGAPKVYVLGN